MLTDLESVKAVLGIADADTSQDAVLTIHLTAADAAVKKYCKRELELAIFSEYYNTRGEDKLALRQRPVWQYALSATLTSGQAAITVPSGASDLIAGMPAVLESYISPGVTISSIVGTTVTLSEAVLQSGTAVVRFGVAVWLDTTALAGQAAGAFGDGTFLYPGQGYVLDLDNLNVSKTGLLIRAGTGEQGTWWGTGWGWWGGYGRRGTLTARLPPAWPNAVGAVKAIYAAGYPEGAIPADLAMACVELTCWLYRYAAQGGVLVTSESYRNYSYALGKLSSEPELGGTRQMLSRYREVAL